MPEAQKTDPRAKRKALWVFGGAVVSGGLLIQLAEWSLPVLTGAAAQRHGWTPQTVPSLLVGAALALLILLWRLAMLMAGRTD